MPENAFDNPAYEKQETLECRVSVAQKTQNEKSANTDADADDADADDKKEIQYGIDDVPPWHLCLLLGLQHYMIMVTATISVPFLLAPLMCIQEDDTAKGKLVSSTIFVSGIVTMLQTTFGVRLPIIQGSTFSLLLPAIAILTTTFPNCDTYDWANMTMPEKDEVWMTRMRSIQGAIIVAALFEFLVGFTGAIGIILAFVSPLAIVPTITLIGLALFRQAGIESSTNWGISLLTAFLILLFSQYLTNVKIPFPAFSKGKFKWAKVQIFMLFPVMIALLAAWGFCGILTAAEVFGPESKARTDRNLFLIERSPWFYFPYPFQWGFPTVTVSGVCGMLAGILATITESIGDYYTCAKLSGAEVPPRHAFNRGIGMEGFGSFLAGIFGTGNGSTSYTTNIGAIRITKVASRRVIQVAAVFMLVCGIFGKFGAVFVIMPTPVIGGLYLVLFAFIVSVGLSNLQEVDLNSSRNLFVLGISLFFGLAIPEWVRNNTDQVKTGWPFFDELAVVLLSTQMFVGGALSLILDNTIPGTKKERGLANWNAARERKDDNTCESYKPSCYDLPGMSLFRRFPWCSKMPFSPTYEEVKKSPRKKSIIDLIKTKITTA